MKPLLTIMFITVTVYTIAVANLHGYNLFSIFFSNIMQLSWNGQFNLDFTMYLLLGALFVAWRNKFSPVALMLSLVAFVGGIMFLAPYLLVLYYKHNGNTKKVLLGKHAN